MEDSEPLASARRPNRKATAALALSLLLASLGASIANIALPTLARDFAAPFGALQWVVTGYLATLTIFSVFAGRLGDIYGLRRMQLAGLALFCLASLLCGLASGLWVLIAARALQGVGAAFLMTLTIALVARTAGRERMGGAMGLLGTVSAVGTMLGPSVGGLLLASVGWRSIFLAQLPLGMLALVLTYAYLPRDEGAPKPRAAKLHLIGDRSLLAGLAVNFLVAAVMMTTLVTGPFYLGLRLGLNEILTGLIISVGPLVSIISGIPSGRTVDLLGARHVLTLGLTLLAGGAFGLATLPEWLGVSGYILALVVLTPGYQLFQAANNTAIMADISNDRRGMISGLLSLSRNLGFIAGTSGMGAVFAFGVGTGDFADAPPPAIAAGMQMTFIFAAAMMLAALLLVLIQPRRDQT